jgi:hypothetical protein
MSNVNKNITVQAKLISPPLYITSLCPAMLCLQIFANKEDGIMVSSTGTAFLSSFVKFL